MTFRHRASQKWYHIRHNYLTSNSLVIAVAVFIALSWTWGSIGRMQQNYELQKQVTYKTQQRELAQLEVENLQYQQNYFKTDEYKELAVRTALGYGLPGEKVLIIPEDNTKAPSPPTDSIESSSRQSSNTSTEPKASNFSQWINFFFGGAGRK